MEHIELDLALSDERAAALRDAYGTLKDQAEKSRRISPGAVAYQWMIPVLYSDTAPDPVDWSRSIEAVKPERSALVFQGATLRKLVMTAFGVGSYSEAEHFAKRALARFEDPQGLSREKKKTWATPSTISAFASVVTSPMSCPFEIAARTRRIILPDRVLGMS